MPAVAEDFRRLLRDVDTNRAKESGVTIPSYDAFVQSMIIAIAAITDADGGSDAVWPAMNKFAAYVYDVLMASPNTGYFTRLMFIIMEVSRNEDAKFMLGQECRQGSAYHKKAKDLDEPDCILEVMRRITTLNYATSSAVIEMAMRIIANCCAYDDNNQELIVHRDGIYALLNLSQHGANVSVIIPTLFNVWSGYDEPVTRPHREGDLKASEELLVLDLATWELASAYNMNPSFSTFELLMSWGPKVNEDIWHYLVDLIEASTLPAQYGIENARFPKDSQDQSWSWTFSINGRHYDTIDVAFDSCQRAHEHSTSDSVWSISRAILNFLSQQEARDALLRREDDAIWKILTSSITSLTDEDEIYDETDDDTEDGTKDARIYMEYVHTEMIKLLYQITSEPSFSQNKVRSLSLMEQCITYLEHWLLNRSRNKDTESKNNQFDNKEDEMSENKVDVDRDNEDENDKYEDRFLLAAAAIILAQLTTCEYIQGLLAVNDRLHQGLTLLFTDSQCKPGKHTSPDVLYPAIILVSRLAQNPEKDLPLSRAGVLAGMQRFLTQGGLGLKVPYETVITYKMSVRGRPEVLALLITNGNHEESIMESIFILWKRTIEAGTKLEIGKFLLEVFRTIMPKASEYDTWTDSYKDLLLNGFAKFLVDSATQVAEIFAWICTHAEPEQQRDHGWFGLAMMSYWSQGRLGILQALNKNKEFQDTMLQVSKTPNGPVPQNLMVMLNKLQNSCATEKLDTAEAVFQTAAANMGLNAKYS